MGLGSVLTAAGDETCDAGGTIQQITSTGATIGVTNPFGPITNLEVIAGAFPGFGGAPPGIQSGSVAGVATTVSRSDHTHDGVASIIAGTGISVSAATGNVTVTNTATTFPGFGGPPPAIATASATGAAATASHSDHTHAQDLSVVYAPSLAAAQASGVFQQTYAAPNATPSVLTVAARNVPFGATAATGLLTQDNRLFVFENNAFAFQKLVNASTNVPASQTNVTALFTAINETAGTSGLQVSDSRASATGTRINFTHSRGTWNAPTISLVGDVSMSFSSQQFDGTNYNSSLSMLSMVPSDGTVAVGNVVQIWAINVAIGGGVNVPTPSQFALSADTSRNVYVGEGNIANNAINGFFYQPALAGIPIGVPAQVFGGVRSQNRMPTQLDSTDLRYYAFIGGTWHFSQMMDYDPGANATRVPFVGATTHTLADSASFTFTSGTGTLAVPVVSAVGAGSVTLKTAATTLLLNNGPTTAVLTGGFLPSADVTYDLGANAQAWNNLFVAVLTRNATANTLNFSAVSGAGAMSIQTATTSSFRINHAGGTFPILWESNTTGLAFFGNAPANQAIGGALAAGAVYTATEQSMLNKAYGALRTFGLLS